MNKLIIIKSVLVLLFLTSCDVATKPSDGEKSFTVLAINDVYRIEPIREGKLGGLSRLKTMRDQMIADDPNLLILHGGDFLSPSILSQRFDGEQIVDIMNQMNGDAQKFDDRFFVVPGNHEFDHSGDEGANWFRQRVEESQFYWISSNIMWDQGTHPGIVADLEQVATHKMIEIGGLKVGIFGLTLQRDATKYAPIDENYIGIAKKMSKLLRDNGAEVVIGLTHLFVKDDIEILEQLAGDGPDIIFGGHEHNAMIIDVNGRYVTKADSDLQSATIAKISVDNGKVEAEVETIIVDDKIAEDKAVKANVDAWLETYYKLECDAAPGERCDGVVLGHSTTELLAVDGESRNFETNTGNWLTDTMLHVYEGTWGAQVAFLNSGTIRIGENIPANKPISAQTIKALLPYDPTLYLIELTGSELKQVLNHSTSNWGGKGYWLQVAGMVFRQTDDGIKDLSLMEDGGLRPISDDEVIRAVTVGYILNPNGPQDGYTMLGPDHVIETPYNSSRLHEHITEELLEAGPKGISPIVEGRICTSKRAHPCLLDN